MGCPAIILCFLLIGCDGDDKNAARLTEFDARVDRVFIAIQAAEAEYDYDKAISLVDQIEADIRSAGLQHTSVDIRVGNEVGRVYEAKREHDRLMKDGHVIFEGRRMSSEQWRTLIKERKEAALLAEQEKLMSLMRERLREQKRREQEAQKALRKLAQALDSRGEFDFRRAKWGMNRKDVRETEGSEPVRSEDTFLAYSVGLAGIDAVCVYVFVDDKLARGTYGIVDVHVNPIEYVADFKKLAELLTVKYGTFVRDESFWINDLFRDDINTALSIGYVSFETEWNDSRTRVVLQLANVNAVVTLRLDYTHIASEAIMRAAEMADSLDGL